MSSLSYFNVPVHKGIDPRIDFSQNVSFEAEFCPQDVSYEIIAFQNPSSSNLSVQVPIPSKATGVARLAFVKCAFEVKFTGSDQGSPLLEVGSNDAPRSFPLQRCIETATVQLGNQTFTTNVSDVLDSVLQNLSDEDIKRYCSGTPSMLDMYSDYNDSVTYGNQRNPLAQYGSNSFYITRSGFLDQAVDVVSNTNTAATVRFTVYEPLLFAPFSLNPDHRKSFLGVDRINFSLVLGDLSRVWSHSSAGKTLTISSATIYSGFNPELHLIYFSQNLFEAVPSPLVWSFENFDYRDTNAQTIASGSSGTIKLSNVNINTVPYMVALYVKRSDATQDETTTDTFARIDQVKLSYKNRQGLLANASTEDLYNISRKNGLQMSYSEWSQWRGSIVYLRPEDWGLSPLECPSQLSNTQFSIEVTATNLHSASASMVLNVVFISQGLIGIDDSGLLTVENGLLSQQDVLDVAQQDFMSKEKPFVGSGFFSKIGHAFKNIGRHLVKPVKFLAHQAWKHKKDILKLAKPAILATAPELAPALTLAGAGRRKKVVRKGKKGGILIGGCDDCYDGNGDYDYEDQATDLNNYIHNY